MKSLDKALVVLVPIAIVLVVLNQNFMPFFIGTKNKAHARSSASGRFPAKATSATATPAEETKSAVETKPAVPPPVPSNPKLKSMGNGVFYTYRKNYACAVPGKKNKIPSYVDSFEIVDGQICRTGDVCNEQVSRCDVNLPAGLEFAGDYNSLTYEKRRYNRQNSPIPESCIMPACASLADICRFDEMPPLAENGCPLGCGTILCKSNKPTCPEVSCAAPPQNCEYDGNPSLDQNGCARGCGKLVCDSIRTVEFKCPKISCKQPPENCYYDDSAPVDKNGCKSACGNLVCIQPKTKKGKAVVCPMKPECAVPPAGCNYVGEPKTDEDGCVIGCGSIFCKRNPPEKCKQPQCKPPPEFCRYDGNSPNDFQGCATGCGDLVCNP